jgi:hypothetical protein
MNLILLDTEEPLTKGPRKVWFADFNVDDWTEMDWSMLRRCENSRKKSNAPMDISPENWMNFIEKSFQKELSVDDVQRNRDRKEMHLREVTAEFKRIYPHKQQMELRNMVWFVLLNVDHWSDMKWWEFRIYEEYRKREGIRPSKGPGFPGGNSAYFEAGPSQVPADVRARAQAWKDRSKSSASASSAAAAAAPATQPRHFNMAAESEEEATPRSTTSETFHKVQAPVPQWTGREEDLPGFLQQMENYRQMHPSSPAKMQTTSKRVPDSPLM